MTTVRIKAHCDPEDEFEVLVETFDGDKKIDESIVQHGDNITRHVYEDRSIIVKQIPKEKPSK